MTKTNLEQKIVFVTGKGGVGKSLVAAAIAAERARMGRRVLLVELGDTSYYKDLWNLPEVTHNPTRTSYGFDVALWGGESSLREYVLHYLRMEKLYSLFFDNRVMRALINVAPGLPEIAMLGKVTSGIRNVGPELNYQDIIVDSFATGHTLTLLNTPKAMKAAIPLGPMGHHSSEIDEVVRNPEITKVVVVALLEELPIVESIELVQQLKKDLGIEAEVVANRVLNSPVKEAELKASKTDFGKYLQGVLQRQKDMLARLDDFDDVDLVPQIFSTDINELIKGTGEALRKTSTGF